MDLNELNYVSSLRFFFFLSYEFFCILKIEWYLKKEFLHWICNLKAKGPFEIIFKNYFLIFKFYKKNSLNILKKQFLKNLIQKIKNKIKFRCFNCFVKNIKIIRQYYKNNWK